MFRLPDYGEGSDFPPASSMPLSRLDAMAKHQMQMMMAQSYIEGRKYWAENPDSEPNEVQLEIEKFLEFTGLLPKRVRQSELEQPSPESDEESSSALTISPEPADALDISTKSRSRWRRYLSFSSGSPLSAKFLKNSSSRSRSMSLPLIGKIQRPSFPIPKRIRRLSKTITPPALRRTASEPTKHSPQSNPTSAPKSRRMTLDESQITLAKSRIGADTKPIVQPISRLPRIPRFPCDYLPLSPPTPLRRRRPAKPLAKPKSMESLAPPRRPLYNFDRDPPLGSPNCVRKHPLPPPEWFDTPFPEQPMSVEDEEIEDDEEGIMWYHILLAPVTLLVLVPLAAVLAMIILLLTIFEHLFCSDSVE
ncbi:hypothetical protein EV368DRAFT_66103 [Lentinula lateritia]|uniref:Uncharacterized protein n=1 Tax=Lentinula aff. lateritia TaxID=2804960 RepID=A0ACC1TYI1_9AGAR|nr:hypothetical protein F5876DRAFT_66377 [Lentinula aff. lateritia]KAJ3851022.1 hypothetical protein EV368DRAFT_66103 [Lentinula lateritia]